LYLSRNRADNSIEEDAKTSIVATLATHASELPKPPLHAPAARVGSHRRECSQNMLAFGDLEILGFWSFGILDFGDGFGHIGYNFFPKTCMLSVGNQNFMT
jgi:hypothetical protein